MAACLVLLSTSTGCARFIEKRMDANEAAAVAAIRTIHTAQIQYFSQFRRYAESLSELGKSDILDPKLANGIRNGYRFQLARTEGGYTLTAEPNSFNDTGSRSFYSDQTMLIHQHRGAGMATPQDPQLD